MSQNSDTPFARVALLGDGAWGTALGILLAEKGCRVALWGAFADNVEEMRRVRRNVKFLPDFALPEGIEPTADMAAALAAADLVVFSTPVLHLRKVAVPARALIRPGLPVMTVAKGIERETLLRAGDIIRDCLGREDLDVGLLLGPTHAEEVARRLPASIVASARDAEFARAIQRAFMTPWLRVYTSSDTVGVELAAALKNVIAIAAGICDGLELGDNAKAALITRGLAEITRLGLILGARPETFAGLCGVGDLITTCFSPYGRNLAVGRAIGRGESLSAVLERMGRVVPEGVWTARAADALARRYSVEMPITAEVCQVLFADKPPRAAVADLMTREAKSEHA